MSATASSSAACNLPPPQQPGAQHRLVAPPLPLARRLRRVQCQVRVPEQFVGVRAVHGGGDPDGDRREHVPEASANGSLNASTIRSAVASTAAHVRGVADEQRELVAAEPRRGVASRGQGR